MKPTLSQLFAHFCVFVLALTSGLFSLSAGAKEASPPMVMTVYKSPSCGCCGDWVDHIESSEFSVTTNLSVTTNNVSDVNAFKQKAGLTRELASCHTAFVEGYVIEGHVPASDVQRLLEERPDIKGLSVPGMPAGRNVPGMEVVDSNANFNVYAIGHDGEVVLWNHYE